MTFKSLSLITATLLLTTNTHANETLEPITIISANKTTQSIQNTTSNVTVITAEDIEEHGYQTVAEAINRVSGITVSCNGGIGQLTSIFVRGFDSGKTLVLLDGMRLNDPSTTDGRALLDGITTNNIQQIEIVKGGMGSIWGSNASAGVINIITKETKEGLHGTLGLNYGSYYTKGAEVQLSYKDKKLTAQVLASYLDTDGFSALAPRDAEADGNTNKNLNLKLGYVLDENNKLKLSYNTIHNDTEYDVGSPDDTLSTINSNQDNAALEYLFTLENYSAIVHASRGKYDREAKDAFDGINTYDSTIEEYSLINALTYVTGKAILGFEYKDIDGNNQYHSAYYDSIADVDYTSKAVYLSNTYNITIDTLLETNLRYDDFDAFDSKVTYKIGLKHHYHFLPGFTASANYYTSYDAPSTYQLSDTLISEPLTPSYTKGYDLSFSYKKLLNLTYFNNTVEDSIEYMTDPLTYEDWYQNVDGRSKFSGLEVESSYTFNTLNVIVSANYTHLFNYEKEDGTDLLRRAKDTFNASVDYYTQNDTHFGIDAQYIGDRKDIGYNPAPFYTPFSTSTGNYTVWNLNFSTEIINDVDLSLNARNIFDKEYQSVYGYATEGRSLYAKIKYSF